MTHEEKRALAAKIGDEALDFEAGSPREAFIEGMAQGDPLLGQFVRQYIADLKQVLPTRTESPPNQPAERKNRRGIAVKATDGIVDGRYKLVRQLGVGGMGRVFRATDIETGQPVAIKFIRSAQALSADARMRFVREARAIGGLQHPNIVSVRDIGQSKGTLYIVMEYVPGFCLDLVAADISLRSKLAIMAQVCDALGCAHAHGIVHRDVKPSNILVLPHDSVKVVDFGIAEQGDLPNSLVQRGGTIPYMSPEQIAGQDVDSRSDIWSTGVTLFFSLTGKLPYHNWQEIIAAPPPLLPEEFPLSSQINAILARALAKDREARYARAEECAADLRQLLETYHLADLAGNPTRTAESFGHQEKYVLPDLDFTFPLIGELTATERTFVKPRERENIPSDQNHLFRQLDDRSHHLLPLVIGGSAALLSSGFRPPLATVIGLIIVLITGTLLALLTWAVLLVVAWAQEMPAQLPRCQKCQLWMQRTAHWLQLVNTKEGVALGYNDCVAALKVGLWQDAVKLLSIHRARYDFEDGSTRFVRPVVKYHLDFFECKSCGDHAARLTHALMKPRNYLEWSWERQPRFLEVYWGTSSQEPSGRSRLTAALRACLRVLAEHIRHTFRSGTADQS